MKELAAVIVELEARPHVVFGTSDRLALHFVHRLVPFRFVPWRRVNAAISRRLRSRSAASW